MSSADDLRGPGRRLAPEVRRAQIVTAATEQIAERGYNAFTLSRVATDCGITRAGILHYFGSKEELLVAVLERRDELDQSALLEESETERDVGPTRARAVLDALVRRNSSQREIVRLYTVLGAEALNESHPAHAYFAARLDGSRTLLVSLFAAWHPAPDDFATEILSFMDGLQLNWLRDESIDLERLWAAVADRLFSR